MEAVSSSEISRLQLSDEKLHIRARDLLTYFQHYADKIKVLSLDCFDTLLWRKTIEPKDVFFDMQRRENFQSLDITAINRIDAESNARAMMYVQMGHHEVTLNDIYRVGFPSLTHQEIDLLIEEEILSEIEACYAYPPIIELIRSAHSRGIKIIIVSNTYLKKNQLKRLLASVLPDDVLTSFHEIFCSCDYNQSKTNGLFKTVLSELNEQPQMILHIGDNEAADLDYPRKHGLHALHLVQFDSVQTEYLRLQCMSAAINDTTVHHTRSMASPFRGLFSSAVLDTSKPESIIGYMSIGPVMYSFARFLEHEISQLKKQNKKPKILFMMRDAYLPSLACEALLGELPGTRIRLSRFSSIAASIRNRENIAECLASVLDSGEFDVVCKQLLLPQHITDTFLAKAELSADPNATFCQLVMQDQIVNYIISQSKAYWARLRKYLEKEVNIQEGDTLVFVDLGYLGRSQRWLTPILQSEMGVEVTGRYLIVLNSPEWKKTRSGLIDPSWCDDRVMEVLSIGNTLLEELCCNDDRSVLDYDEQGNPIYTDSSTMKAQHDKTKRFQAECIRFIHDAKHFFETVGADFSFSMLRDIALAELIRRSYLPLQTEIDYLQEYRHDANLGTSLYCKAFETPDTELTSLRRQGLWFKNQNPYGLRAAGLELSLTLMSKHRHGFPTNLADLSLRRENILIIQSHSAFISKKIISAFSTHDGYFSLWFVIDNLDMQIAILFGLNYQALQIESIEQIKAMHFLKEKHSNHVQDIMPTALVNQVIKKDNNYYECTAKTGSLIIPFKSMPAHSGKVVLRVVFRPIINRIDN
ncbi:MAG: HAD family hydrolase [Gammaproteobacteria bacterium]